MAPIKATCCTLLAFFLNSAIATPDSAVMARLARPVFTPSASTTVFRGGNSTTLFPTGTGTGFAAPTGYGFSATSTLTTRLSPIPILETIQRRKAPSKASAGFGEKDCYNGTHHHATGHPHGTGAASCTGSVGTTRFTLPSIVETPLTLATSTVTPAVQRRLVHIHSGGFSSSTSSNETLADSTGTGTGIGVIHATGAGTTGTASTTGAIVQPTFMPAVVGRSKKAASSWWG